MTEKSIARGLTVVPTLRDGQVQVRRVNADASIRNQDEIRKEADRIEGIERRRLYYLGRQYEKVNDVARQTHCRTGTDVLPEHHRKHAYSTQIQDCLEYIASMVAGGMSITAQDRRAQEVIDRFIRRSPQLVTYDETGALVPSFTTALEESLVAGDVVAHVRWDPVEAVPYAELWESEKVQFVMSDTERVDAVLRQETVWRWDPIAQQDVQAVEIEVYSMQFNDETGQEECRREVWWENADSPHDGEWLEVGRIPWIPLRAGLPGLREHRGASLISEQSMETADRFNAVEQQGFLISRYNSHANIAVIGDAATLKIESEGAVHKDVADVLTFPGGTALQVLSLPTDPQMIEHQRNVLSEALHAQFGVTRLEPESLSGMGGVTGYALEILNQKSRATTAKITRQWRKDLAALFDLVFDVTAWKEGGQGDVDDDDSDDETAIDEGSRWWEVDPEVEFPNRSVAIVMGMVDVVDEARVRADFQAGMISREEALRQRGYESLAIRRILREIDAEKTKAQERVLGFGEGTRPGLDQDEE